MNIFLTDPCPEKCAEVLDDKRVVKMTLETAQLLATACDMRGVDLGYKITHINHPCSIWARTGRLNFDWLIEHGLWLADQYSKRYSRTHSCYDLIKESFKHRGLFDGQVPLVFSFNSSGFDTGDVFTDYKMCLVHKWKNLDSRKPTWTGEGRPSFYREFYTKV